MGYRHLLCCLFFCLPLLQTHVSPLTIKSVYPHANVLMQFGAEHSPAPCDGNAQEAAKIDGETKLGIDVPRGADHRNILLHKIGNYLALVMKALAKTVEPSEVLDGSSTHLDFHVDAELKEPESHVTITERHPTEVVVHTLWTGESCQNIPVDSPGQNTPIDPALQPQGSIGPLLPVSPTQTVIAASRANEGLSVSNISPVNSLLGVLSSANRNFLIPGPVGIPGNDPGLSIGGSRTQTNAVPFNPLALQTILSSLSNGNNNVLSAPILGIITENEIDSEEGVANTQSKQGQTVETLLSEILGSRSQNLPGSVVGFALGGSPHLGGNISPFSQLPPQQTNVLLSSSDAHHSLGTLSQNPNIQLISTVGGLGSDMNDPLSSILRSVLRNQASENGKKAVSPTILPGNHDPPCSRDELEGVRPRTSNFTPVNLKLLSPLDPESDNNSLLSRNDPVAILPSHHAVTTPCTADSHNHDSNVGSVLSIVPVPAIHFTETTYSPIHKTTTNQSLLKSNEQAVNHFESQRAAASSSDSGKLAVIESLKSVNYIPKEGVPYHVETHKINKLIDSRLSPESLLHDRTHKLSAAEVGHRTQEYKVYPPSKKDHSSKYVQYKQKFYDRDRSLDSDPKMSKEKDRQVKYSDVLNEENDRARNLPLDDISPQNGVLPSGNATENIQSLEPESLPLSKSNETEIKTKTTTGNSVNTKDSFAGEEDNINSTTEVRKQPTNISEVQTTTNISNLNNVNANDSFLKNQLTLSPKSQVPSSDPKSQAMNNTYFLSSNNIPADTIGYQHTNFNSNKITEIKREQLPNKNNSRNYLYITPQQYLHNDSQDATTFTLSENGYNKSAPENSSNTASPEFQYSNSRLRNIDLSQQKLNNNLTLAKPTSERILNYKVVSAASPFEPADSKQKFSEILTNETTLSLGVNDNDYSMIVTPSSYLSEDWGEDLHNFPEYEEIISDVNQIPYGFFIEEADYNTLSTTPQDTYFGGSKSNLDFGRSELKFFPINSGYVPYFIENDGEEVANEQYVSRITYGEELDSDDIYETSSQPAGYKSISLPSSSSLSPQTDINTAPTELVNNHRNFVQGNEMRLAKDYNVHYPTSTFKNVDVHESTIPPYATEYITVSQKPNAGDKYTVFEDQIQVSTNDYDMHQNQYNRNKPLFQTYTISPHLDSVTENAIRPPYGTNEIERHSGQESLIGNDLQMYSSYGVESLLPNSQHKQLSDIVPGQYVYINQEDDLQNFSNILNIPLESLLLERLMNNKNPTGKPVEKSVQSQNTNTLPPSFTERVETPIFIEHTTKNNNIDQLKFETRMQRNNVPVEVSQQNSHQVMSKQPELQTNHLISSNNSPKVDRNSDVSSINAQKENGFPNYFQQTQIHNEPVPMEEHTDDMYTGIVLNKVLSSTIQPFRPGNFISDEPLLTTYVEEETSPYSSVEDTIDISEKFNKGVFTFEPNYQINLIKSHELDAQKDQSNKPDLSYIGDQSLNNDVEIFKPPYQTNKPNDMKYSGKRDESIQKGRESLSDLQGHTYLVNNLPNSYGVQNKMSVLSAQAPTYDVIQEPFSPHSPMERQIFQINQNIPIHSEKEQSYDLENARKHTLLENSPANEVGPNVNLTSESYLSKSLANFIVQVNPDHVYTPSPSDGKLLYQYEITDQTGPPDIQQVSLKKISEISTEQPISKLYNDASERLYHSDGLPVSHVHEKKAPRTFVITDDYKSQSPQYESKITINKQFETPSEETINHVVIQRQNKTADVKQYSVQQINAKDLEVGLKEPEISPEVLQYIVSSMRDVSLDKSGGNVIETKKNGKIQIETGSTTTSPDDYSVTKYENSQSFDLMKFPNPSNDKLDSKKGTAIYSYFVGEDGLKPRLICLTDHMDNIEILHSLKEDITKLKQKLNCE